MKPTRLKIVLPTHRDFEGNTLNYGNFEKQICERKASFRVYGIIPAYVCRV
jgi:hypothetical protein